MIREVVKMTKTTIINYLIDITITLILSVIWSGVLFGLGYIMVDSYEDKCNIKIEMENHQNN